MHYEVEMKFPVGEAAAFVARLGELGVAASEPCSEVDVYFAHPARDFARTDEALRLRRKGERFFITYKGPKVDPTTKTRREIEIPLEGDEARFHAWFALLGELGFTPAGEVKKRRRKAEIPWQGHAVEGLLDEVEGLGSYVELELIADADGLDTARQCLASLAQRLGLTGSERRSYLELLRQKN